jgi:hypothetical protein
MAVRPPRFPVTGDVILGGPDQVRSSTARRLSQARPASRRSWRYRGRPVHPASAAWECLAGHSSPRSGTAAAMPAGGAWPGCVPVLPVSNQSGRPGPHPGSCGRDARTAAPRHAEDLPRRRHSREAERLAVPVRTAGPSRQACVAGSTRPARLRLLPAPMRTPFYPAPEITASVDGGASPEPISHVVTARPSSCRAADPEPP